MVAAVQPSYTEIPETTENSFVPESQGVPTEKPQEEVSRREINWTSVPPLAATGLVLAGAGTGAAYLLSHDNSSYESPRQRVATRAQVIFFAVGTAGIGTSVIDTVYSNRVLSSKQEDYVNVTFDTILDASMIVGSGAMATGFFMSMPDAEQGDGRALLAVGGGVSALTAGIGAFHVARNIVDGVRYNKVHRARQVSLASTGNGIALQGTF